MTTSCTLQTATHLSHKPRRWRVREAKAPLGNCLLLISEIKGNNTYNTTSLAYQSDLTEAKVSRQNPLYWQNISNLMDLEKKIVKKILQIHKRKWAKVQYSFSCQPFKTRKPTLNSLLVQGHHHHHHHPHFLFLNHESAVSSPAPLSWEIQTIQTDQPKPSSSSSTLCQCFFFFFIIISIVQLRHLTQT